MRQDQVRAMQKLLAEQTSSHLEVKQFGPPQWLGTLGARWSPKELRAQRHRGSSRPARPKLDILAHQNQAVVDAGSEHFAVCSRSSCVASERRGNAGKVANRAHCKIPCASVSRAHTGPSKEAWSTHTVVSTMQVRRLLWANKWLREETYPEDERTGAGEAMRAMVFGRLSPEKGQAPPSRFVRQFLKDLDDSRRFVYKAEEGDRAVEDARTAAGVSGIDFST